MKLLFLIALIVSSFSACAENKEKNQNSIRLQDVIHFKGLSPEKAFQRFGPSSENSRISLQGNTYLVYRFIRQTHPTLDLFISDKSQQIVEKVFYTDNGEGYEFQNIVDTHFPNISFLKSSISCSHHNNFIYYNLNEGIYLVTEGSASTIIKAIGFASGNQIQIRLKENKERKCH